VRLYKKYRSTVQGQTIPGDTHEIEWTWWCLTHIWCGNQFRSEVNCICKTFVSDGESPMVVALCRQMPHIWCFVRLFVWWCLMPLSTIFSYIVAVSFIGGRNCRIRRKQPTCRKSLTNFIT
jgi:hypothetical protein